MKKEVTSEEKLLDLIRKKNPAEKKETKPKESMVKAAWAQSSASARDFSDFPKTLTRILLIFSLGLLFYIASHVFLSKPASDSFMALKVQEIPEDAVAQEEEILPAPKPFTDYAQILSQRDIFASPFQQAQMDAAVSQADVQPVVPTFDLNKNFKLVGIILDNDPKAVVEDVRNQRTLFLSKGDQLEGAVLEEIHDGKVIFLMNSQRVELVP